MVIVLLDLDGVLIDDARWDAEWERLGGAEMARLLGADPGECARRTDEVWQRVEGHLRAALFDLPSEERPKPARWWDDANDAWIAECGGLPGAATPADRAGRIELAERALRFHFANTRAAFPGTAEAIARLHRRFEIHTASGNPALVVETLLESLGVRSLVGQPFGSDLAGAYKDEGTAFYRAIATALGTRPAELFVVDDDPRMVAAARGCGAAAIRVTGPTGGGTAPDGIATLAELPDRLGC